MDQSTPHKEIHQLQKNQHQATLVDLLQHSHIPPGFQKMQCSILHLDLKSMRLCQSGQMDLVFNIIYKR